MLGDRGSSTLELVIWAPALLLILAATVLAGRLALAHQAVEAAAGEAARAATAAATAAQARTEARGAAAAALSSAGLDCTATAVDVDTSQWARPVGVAGRATATVTCTVGLADLALPGVPGSRTVTATAASALDTYRERP